MCWEAFSFQSTTLIYQFYLFYQLFLLIHEIKVSEFIYKIIRQISRINGFMLWLIYSNNVYSALSKVIKSAHFSLRFLLQTYLHTTYIHCLEELKVFKDKEYLIGNYHFEIVFALYLKIPNNLLAFIKHIYQKQQAWGIDKYANNIHNWPFQPFSQDYWHIFWHHICFVC